MPVYVYQTLNADGTDGDVFEIEQSAGDPPLTAHPLTGAVARRVFLAPHLAGQYNERRVRAQIGDADNLAQHGFSRYEKDKVSGKYHKTAGRDPRAPQTIDPRHLPSHPQVDAALLKNRSKS
ncbi:MAG: hypothetical protein LBV28_02180 [Puniceicoccales bacterium]|jgi:hypothetical protein|nr:hypothetical protein [Puniceicoccales bacterium]